MAIACSHVELPAIDGVTGTGRIGVVKVVPCLAGGGNGQRQKLVDQTRTVQVRLDGRGAVDEVRESPSRPAHPTATTPQHPSIEFRKGKGDGSQLDERKWRCPGPAPPEAARDAGHRGVGSDGRPAA